MMGDPNRDPAPRMFKVKVTQIIDPQSFMAWIGAEADMVTYLDREESLHTLGKELSEEPANLGLNEDSPIGEIVLAHSSTWSKWVRAQVHCINSDHGEVDVLCIDYGTTELVKVEEIITQPQDVLSIWPQHAHRCTLAAVQPIANVWIKRAITHFQTLVLNQDLWCHVIEEDPQGRIVVDIYFRDDLGNLKSVSEKLHLEGFAKLTRSSTSVVKVPKFSVHQLHQTAPPTEVAKDENVNDDIETRLYLEALGFVDDSPQWVQSDATIGTGPMYESNVKPDVISTIQEEIRLMKQVNLTDGDDDSGASSRNSPGPEDSTSRESNQISSDRNGRGVRDMDSERARARRGRGRGRRRRDDVEIPTVELSSRKPRQTEMSAAVDESLYDTKDASETDNGSQTAEDGPVESEEQTEGQPQLYSSREASLTRSPPPSPRISHSSRDSSPALTKELFPSNHDGKSGLSQPVVEDVRERRDSGSDRRKRPLRHSRCAEQQQAKSLELENEYGWQRLKVERKVKKLIKFMTSPEMCEEKIAHLKDIIYSGPSKLEPLPGPKELHVCLEEVLIHAVEHDSFSPVALRVVEALKDDTEFATAITQIFGKLHSEYVRVTTNVTSQCHAKTFAELAGHLFVLANKWTSPSRDAVIVSVTNTFERWCIFNKGNQHPSPDELHAVYLTCLSALMEVAGEILESRWPAKTDEGFSVLEAKSQSSALSQSVRTSMVTLLDRRRTGWPQVSNLAPAGATESVEPNAIELKKTKTTAKDMCQRSEVATNTEQSVRDAHTQTTSKARGRDAYAAVRLMLYELDMEQLLENFTTNAVRDTLLQMEFSELRVLLKEIGLLPGHVWEIKQYLESNDGPASCCVRSSRESSLGGDDMLSHRASSVLDNMAGDCSQVDVRHPKVELLSPECFQGSSLSESIGRPSEVQDLLWRHAPQSVDTVGMVQAGDESHSSSETEQLNTDLSGVKTEADDDQSGEKRASSERPSKRYSFSGILDVVSGWLNKGGDEAEAEPPVPVIKTEVSECVPDVQLEDTDKTGESVRYIAAGSEDGDLLVEDTARPAEPSEQEVRYYQHMFKDVIITSEDDVEEEELDDDHLEEYRYETQLLEGDLYQHDGSSSPTTELTAPTIDRDSPTSAPSLPLTGRPRHCTACGAMDHIIYDCPEKHSKFFI